jgi:hypothetical protein
VVGPAIQGKAAALTVYFDGGDSRVIARTNDHPVRWIKAHRPGKVESNA